VDTVRVGVIGQGAIAKNLHLPSLHSHAGAQIVALCGRDQDKAQGFAKEYDIPSIYADYREMLEKEALDAVLVLTPDDCHYPMTMAAIDAGCHVLCEKPLAMSASEAEEMLEAATKKGITHMTFLNQRELPHFAYAKRLIEEGYIGKPLHCSCSFTTQGSLQRDHASWHSDARRCAGALGNFGSHIIDMTCWFMGEVTGVAGSVRCFRPPTSEDSGFIPANDSALLNLEFENEAHGTIYVGSVSATVRSGKHYRIDGDAGAMEIDQSYFEPISEIRGGKVGETLERLSVPAELCGGADEPREMADYMRWFTSQSVGTRGFIDAVLEGRQHSPSFADGLAVQRIMDAAIESSETRRWIAIEPNAAGGGAGL
jgi:predicted dehydrogenase